MFVCMTTLNVSGLSIIELWGPGGLSKQGGRGENAPILADQQSLSQPAKREGQIMPATLLLTNPSSGFSDLPTALYCYPTDTSKLEVVCTLTRQVVFQNWSF